MRKKEVAKVTLEKLEKTEHTYYNTFCVIYGARNTGKTTIVFEMMWYLRNLIKKVFVISQSASANDQFSKFVPKSAVISDITEEWFAKLLAEQKILSQKYRESNELRKLRPIYCLVETNNDRVIEKNITKKCDDVIEEMWRDHRDDPDTGSLMERTLRKLEEESLRDHYKKVIIKRKEILMRNNLNEDQLHTLKWFMRDPSLLIVFDDCASIFDEWARKNPGIGEIIYNGRHYYITLIITTQDDSDIMPKFRKQAQYSIFTDRTMASSFFGRSEKKNESSTARKAIEFVWNGPKKNWKLAYSSESRGVSPFYYLTVGYKDNFTIGSKKFWELCEKNESERRKKLLIERRDYN